jgi:transcriptional regulator GlxA family with amidase domain
MQIAFGLYEGFTSLDAIGPYQVLSNLPGADVVVCAEKTGRLNDDNNILHFEIEHSFADVPRPDILLVPGGMVTRKLAVAGEPIVEWVRAAHPHTTWTTSVCTGSLILGAAGVLNGLRATTHWASYEHLRGFGAEPTGDRVVVEGKVATAAGVSAGIDLALTLAGIIAGDEVAQGLQLAIEYDPQPPYDAGSPAKCPQPVYEVVKAIVEEGEAALLAQ